MELRHLRYFVAVAEHLSFTAAAESLGLSQPPLSQQIRDLEAEIGTDLFERSSRRVALTPAGRDFLDQARLVLAQAGVAVDRARTIGRGSAGILRLGLTGSMLLGPLGRLIRRFGQRHQAVDLRIHELSPDDQVAALRAGRTDLSFLRSPPDEPALAREPAWSERIVLALARDHPLARAPTAHSDGVPLAALRDEPFVSLRLRDSRFANDLHGACVAAGFVPVVAQQVVEATSLVSLVAAGLGVALIPEFAARLQLADVAIRPILPPCPAADVHAVYAAGAGPIAGNFLALMREEAGPLAEALRAGLAETGPLSPP